MTDKNTLQITAQLYRVASDFSARAGDRVMIVGGVCIGTYTGETPAAAPKAATVKAAAPLAKASVPGKRKIKGPKTQRPLAETTALRQEMRRVLCAEFRRHDDLTITANEFGKLYPLPAEKYHLRLVLTEMRDDRIISIRGAGRSASYTLLNSSICEAKAEATSAGEMEHATTE